MGAIATLLKEARIKKGLTQIEVSRRLGYTSPQFISNWERGLAAPPPKIFNSLSKLIDVEPQTLADLLVADFKAKVQAAITKNRRRR